MLLLLHLLPRYRLIQTIFSRALTRLYCVVLEVRKEEKNAGWSSRLVRNHFTVVTNSLGAWENLLQQKRKKQNKLHMFHSAGSLFKNTQICYKRVSAAAWSISISLHLTIFIKSSSVHAFTLCSLFTFTEPLSLCNGIKAQTALCYVSTAAPCRVHPESLIPDCTGSE